MSWLLLENILLCKMYPLVFEEGMFVPVRLVIGDTVLRYTTRLVPAPLNPLPPRPGRPTLPSVPVAARFPLTGLGLTRTLSPHPCTSSTAYIHPWFCLPAKVQTTIYWQL